MADSILVGVVGHPIGHTLSPVMHAAAAKAAGIALSYGVADVPPAMIGGFCRALRKAGLRGCNVTIPHKESVAALCDETTAAARELGAVNVLVVDGGRLVGHNTDIDGIAGPLSEHQAALRGSRVVILGAGGAARAAAYAIGNSFEVSRVDIVNRTADRSGAVVAAMRRHFPAVEWRSSALSTLPAMVADARLILQATSVGMAPDADGDPVPAAVTFSKEQIIFDIVYNPLDTALLRRARRDGATTIRGLEMFVRQGAKAFELWTGKPFPLAAAREAVLSEFQRRVRSEGDGE